MAKVIVWWQHESQSAPGIVVHALKENKRPIGFAPWPAVDEVEETVNYPSTKKRKKKRKK